MTNPITEKFWHKRYSLFSKFDQGIQMDSGNNSTLTHYTLGYSVVWLFGYFL